MTGIRMREERIRPLITDTPPPIKISTHHSIRDGITTLPENASLQIRGVSAIRSRRSRGVSIKHNATDKSADNTEAVTSLKALDDL